MLNSVVVLSCLFMFSHGPLTMTHMFSFMVKTAKKTERKSILALNALLITIIKGWELQAFDCSNRSLRIKTLNRAFNPNSSNSVIINDFECFINV